MKKYLLLVLAAALMALMVTSSMAATWTKIGSSGMVTDPAKLQDWWRPVPNHMITDDAGNIYVTVNNGNNRGVTGGITIFHPNGSKTDVDLNALGYPGAVTKMVKGGDGKIYCLQNWREAWASVNNGGGSIGNYRLFMGEGIPDKIIRVEANGSVTKIHEAIPHTDGWVSQIGGGTTSTIVDIDGTNKGIEMARTTEGAVCQYYRQLRDPSCTIGARFKVTAFTPGASRTDMFLLLPGNTTVVPQSPYAPFVVLGLDTDSHFKIWSRVGGDTVIQDLGLLDTNTWYEMFLHVDGNTGLVKVKWNDVEYSTTITDPANLSAGTGGWCQFGAAIDTSAGGTSTVIFDWVGYGRGYISSETPTTDWVAYNDGSPFYFMDETTLVWDGKPMRDNNRVQGMAVGSDGNVYFTAGSINAFWKTHFIWRYNIGTNTIEEGQPGVNNGQSYVVLFSDLEYFGKDEFGEDIFALMKQQDSAGSDWRLHAIKFSNLPRQTTAPAAAAWGRHFPMRTAYDPLRQKFWAAGWGVSGGYTWNVANANGGTSAVVDLGSGNSGLACSKTVQADPTKPASSGWTLKYTGVTTGVGTWQVPAYTSAARFKIDAGYTDMSGARFLFTRPVSLPKVADPVAPHADQTYAPAVSVGIDNIDGQDRWVLSLRVITSVTPWTTADKLLVDIGPVVPGVFNEAYIYAESSLHDTPRRVKAWWNGTLIFDQDVSDADSVWNSDGSWIQVGNHCGSFWAAPNGAATVTFDWFGVGRNVIAPSDASKNWDYYFNGSTWPQLDGELRTHVMIAYNGDYANGRFLDSAYNVKSVYNWHANDNNPQILDHKRTPGYYWVPALAVNPVDGKAWMGWNAEASYNMDDIGHVLTRDIAYNYGDEGVPEPGACITSLMFANNKVYAAVCNLTTGIYSLYAADVPGSIPTTVAKAKSSGVGAWLETTSPVIVTYPADGTGSYFYVQDADRSSGIKVIPPSPADVRSQGDMVNISGYVDVENGEAVLRARTVSIDSSFNPDPKPLGSVVRNVGGVATGAQPATSPAYGLSNVGLLVKIVGKVGAYVQDDIATYTLSTPMWFTIDDGSGAVTEYMNAVREKVTVPGIKVFYNPGTFMPVPGAMVSAVGVVSIDQPIEFDPMSAGYEYVPPVGQRLILPRTDADIQEL